MNTNCNGNLHEVMHKSAWDLATVVPTGDIRALKHRIHALEGELLGYKKIVVEQDAMLERRAACVLVPLNVLEAAEESLGNFCSDHGWSDKDMQNMDNLSAYIAQHKAAHSIKE